MRASARAPSRPSSRGRHQAACTLRGWLALVLCSSAGAWSCSSAGVTAAPGSPERAPANAPLVATQPGAWFDAQGSLTIVGAGRRLRLVLSAPISACAPALQGEGAAADVVLRASLPFHVLSETCRELHPSILLAEESDTASPTELERSYHEVAHCAGNEWGLSDGWVPKLVAESDPCPIALGSGWHLPRTAELEGLTVDDRKAVAGALFDTEDRTAFGGLLVYARAAAGELVLSTLSPNAAEQAPTLADEQRGRPFFGAALRCVQDVGAAPSTRATLPMLPHAAACLLEQKKAQGLAVNQPSFTPAPEVQKLKAWVDLAERNAVFLRNDAQLKELSQLLASPALEQVARDSAEERALTERYADLAESLDDPAASPAERQRRHAEFDSLRKRLGGQIVQHAQAAGSDRTQLALVLSRLETLLEVSAHPKNPKKIRLPDYAPLIARVRELRSGKAAKP